MQLVEVHEAQIVGRPVVQQDVCAPRVRGLYVPVAPGPGLGPTLWPSAGGLPALFPHFQWKLLVPQNILEEKKQQILDGRL